MNATPVPPAANRFIDIPRFELGDEITPEQAEFFETMGFIRFKSFVSKERAAELAKEVEEAEQKLIAEGVQHINGTPLFFGERPDGRKFVQRMCFASLLCPGLHEMLEDPRLQGILRFAGPGFRIGEKERDGLVVNHYRNEQGSKFRQQGWHTDSVRDLFFLEKPRRYLNVGFYLDDSPITKGGVRLIPYSHKQNVWNMLTRKAYYFDTGQDPAEYALEAEAGDLTFHDGRIWHRAARATATGDDSQRRVMYLPFMDGPLKEKHPESPMPLYFRLRHLAPFLGLSAHEASAPREAAARALAYHVAGNLTQDAIREIARENGSEEKPSKKLAHFILHCTHRLCRALSRVHPTLLHFNFLRALGGSLC